MTRDELAKRSEGALDTVDDAVIRTDLLVRLLREPDWLFRVREAPALIREEVEREKLLDEAVARVQKLDASAVEPLTAARARLAKIAASRLRDLDVDSTASKLEDLLAQLVARCLDRTYEQQRTAAASSGPAGGDGWDTAALISFGGGLAATSLLAASAAVPIWAAGAPVLLGVVGAIVFATQRRTCPGCGRAIRAEKCPHCHHTRPSD